MFRPIVARKHSLDVPGPPSISRCVRFVFMHAGSVDLLSSPSWPTVRPGDVILVGPQVRFNYQAPGRFEFTCIALDVDYAIDQVFWRYSDRLSDRLDAEQFASQLYPDSFKILPCGEHRLGELLPTLEELVQLSANGRHQLQFHRFQELWFRVAGFLEPFLVDPRLVGGVSGSRHVRTAFPVVRRFAPLRADVQAAAYLLRSDPSRRWTVQELASEVHLSRSHLGAVFTLVFGISPMAYLTNIRVELIARYLRETDLPTETVMRLVGWQSRTHAARMFQSHIGMTPSAYRRLRGHLR